MRENRRLLFRDVLLAEEQGGGPSLMSLAFFCPACGEVWGRLVRGPTWLAVSRPCDHHGTPYAIGGTFFGTYKWWGDEQEMERLLLTFPLLRHHEFWMALHWRETWPDV